MAHGKKRKTANESLLDAVRQGDFVAVRHYIEDEGADIEARDQRNRTALHIATEHGFTLCIEALIDLGARIDPTDHQKATPLMIAAERGLTDTVNLLLANGADIMLKNAKGQTAFHIGGEKPATKDTLKKAWMAALDKHPLDLDVATKNAVPIRKPLSLKAAAPPQ